jgi:sulfoxide reductase heme-binding subunit YedZ
MKRPSRLKTAVLVLLCLPGAWLAAEWAGGALGARPITEVLHGLGEWTVRLMLITLAVTPARAVLDWPGVVRLRRMLGVATALYALAHLTLYACDQGWSLATVAGEIVRRFYLAIGFVALLGLAVLAVTSTNAWQRRLGRAWKRLHLAVFPLLGLMLWHYFLQAKADVDDAAVAAGFALWLVLWRLMPRRWRGRIGPLWGLAPAAALAGAAIEAGWYALATGAPARLVLEANLDLSFGPRPAVVVLIAGLALAAAAQARKQFFFSRKKEPKKTSSV